MDVHLLEQQGLRPGEAGPRGDPILLAKYVDFCSAQLTEVFLSLSDERIYELVEEAADDADVHIGSLGFTSMVRLVTHRLRENIPLPDFETWSDDYTSDPARYDPYLIGLWEELLARPGPDDPGS